MIRETTDASGEVEIGHLNLPQFHTALCVVYDLEIAQLVEDFSKLSVNGKRHAKAMIAGLLRLEAGAA